LKHLRQAKKYRLTTENQQFIIPDVDAHALNFSEFANDKTRVISMKPMIDETELNIEEFQENYGKPIKVCYKNYRGTSVIYL
jgi:hypothetical protein